MKLIGGLSVFSFLVLSAASVWMGALNQDEGWYLYAANLIAEGNVPYRDFFFTQGPMMPMVYSAFSGIWKAFGLLGARVFTLFIGALGLAFAVALTHHLAPAERKRESAWIVFILLATNLYHLYYLTIPKTYALASLFVLVGVYLLILAAERRAWLAVLAGLSLAFAAGTRISLGLTLAVAGLWLLFSRRGRVLAWFCLGGFAGLALVYGPFLLDVQARAGLMAAQQYHAARGGSDFVWFVGSVSRLLRWYLPIFLLLGLYVFDARRTRPVGLVLPVMFLAVFVLQMAAPFPYEDYQVPIMALLAVFAAVNLNMKRGVLLALGVSCALSLGSPLLERWATNGQDRFWSLKKGQYELPQLRAMAAEIEKSDPGGHELLTQDTYLAIETNRRVPKGLEMGPFSVLSDAAWRDLLEHTTCPVAALSGYTFAVEPPKCAERPLAQQLAYWQLLKERYELVSREDYFGQNATPLLILKRKDR